jgi:succinate dehydrogenase/fumarate reductase flavoprotein subunit
MVTNMPSSPPRSARRDRPRLDRDTADAGLETRTDVLVIGGGPAGCWAAIAAAQAGASVVLADKGYCGTTGAAASAGVGVWYVEPDPEARERAIAEREAMGGWLVDRTWMHRVLDETFTGVGRLADWGYPFPTDESDRQARTTLQGPEYLRRMRRQVVRARATILDHSPALELLRDGDGAVAGAAGIRLRTREPWTIHAGAVVLATGGCTFRSGGLGCDVLTGDGHLMAAELGADLSGMEFSNAYAISPVFASVTKTAFYHWATFFHENGEVLEGAGSQHGRSVIARALLHERVFCQLDRAPHAIHDELRWSQPNFFLPFDRVGIDPFRRRFEITLRLEGTMRGTGGLRLHDDSCATAVPGLYAAGDVATRELICGGFTGGGSHNAAWAIASGTWAGRGAARHGRARGTGAQGTGAHGPAARGAGAHGTAAHGAGVRPAGRAAEPAGEAGLRPVCGTRSDVRHTDVVDAVRAEVDPYDRNWFRTEEGLTESLRRLDRVWSEVRDGLGGTRVDVVRRREAAAMVAHARWMYRAGRARAETRGMHRRTDRPQLDPGQHHRRLVGGLDRVWSTIDPAAPVSVQEPAVR